MVDWLKRWVVRLFFEHTNFKATARLHTGDRLRVDLSSSVGRSIWYPHGYESDVERSVRNHLKTGGFF